MATNLELSRRDYNSILPLIVSVILTMFLFYIDEGYYNFAWMLNIGSWIVFCVYAGVIFGAQMIMQAALGYLNVRNSAVRVLLSIVPAFALAAVVLYFIFV